MDPIQCKNEKALGLFRMINNPKMVKAEHSVKYGGGLVAKSCPTLGTPWTVACKVLLSLGFSRQEYWSGLPFPSPGDLPDPVIEAAFPALAGGFFATEPPGKPKDTSHVSRCLFGLETL